MSPLLLAAGQLSTTHTVFIAPIQVQMQMAVAGLPCCLYNHRYMLQHITVPRCMPIAHAMSAKFKAFSFPAIKSSSVILCFPVSRHKHPTSDSHQLWDIQKTRKIWWWLTYKISLALKVEGLQVLPNLYSFQTTFSICMPTTHHILTSACRDGSLKNQPN